MTYCTVILLESTDKWNNVPFVFQATLVPLYDEAGDHGDNDESDDGATNRSHDDSSAVLREGLWTGKQNNININMTGTF